MLYEEGALHLLKLRKLPVRVIRINYISLNMLISKTPYKRKQKRPVKKGRLVYSWNKIVATS
jgi:hypothetical protein